MIFIAFLVLLLLKKGFSNTWPPTFVAVVNEVLFVRPVLFKFEYSDAFLRQHAHVDL